MKLSVIFETIEDMLFGLSNRVGLSDRNITRIISSISPNRKHYEFLLKQWYKGNIDLESSDADRAQKILARFEIIKNNLPNKDLLSYKTFDDLDNIVSNYSGPISKRASKFTNPDRMVGVEEFARSNGYISYLISEPEALKILGEGTQWCTRGSYPQCAAEAYFHNFAWVGQIWHNGKPIIQFTPDYAQVMDRENTGTSLEKFADIVPKPDLRHTNGSVLINYALETNQRWQDVEHMIVNLPYSLDYTIKFIGRWPEAEESKLDSLRRILRSTKDPNIVDTPLFHEMGRYSEYLEMYVGHSWKEFEELIINRPGLAAVYATDYLERRWPEAEQFIKLDRTYWQLYTDKLKDQFWDDTEYVPKRLNNEV